MYEKQVEEANRNRGKKPTHHGMIVSYVEIVRPNHTGDYVAYITLETPFEDATVEELEQYFNGRFNGCLHGFRRSGGFIWLDGLMCQIDRVYNPRGYVCITLSLGKTANIWSLNKRSVQTYLDRISRQKLTPENG